MAFRPDDLCESERGMRDRLCAPGAAGFWVRVYDGLTGKLIADDTFETGGAAPMSVHDEQARLMTKALDGVLSRDVVTIESVSNRSSAGVYAAPVSRIDGPEVKQLAVAVAGVGATRNGFNRAVGVAPAAASRGLVYSMAGWGGAS
jgi:hypothetical protein